MVPKALAMIARTVFVLGVLAFVRTRAFSLSPSLAYYSSGQKGQQTTSRLSSIKDDLGDDLTKEELALRFSEVRDYYRESKEMSQENVCLTMLRTRLPNLRLSRCYVAESTIPQAGQGLFAGRDISKDELITLYPGDALLVWQKDVGDLSADVGVMFGNHVQGDDRNASRVSTDEARSYELKIKTSHSIVADPLLIDDAAYLGHMINDGSALMSQTNAARTMYSQNTFDRHNAAFFVMEGCHYTGIATKNIEKGEEIFASYGEGYWLSRSYNKSAPATTTSWPAGAGF